MLDAVNSFSSVQPCLSFFRMYCFFEKVSEKHVMDVNLMPNSEFHCSTNNDNGSTKGIAELIIIKLRKKSTDKCYNKMMMLVTENALSYAQFRVEGAQLYF